MTPAAALAPDVLAPQATPSFHKWAISDSQGIQLLVLETSGHVALSADPLYIREGVVTVPLPKGVAISVQVHADVVTLAGDLSLPSCAVTIVANRLVVEAGQARPGIATLDVSGADGKPPADPKPVPGQAVTGEKGAGRPLVRREDMNGYRWTGPGAPGGQGASGTPGAKGDTGNAGQRGGRISIASGSIEGARLDLAARGGSGGQGQAGQGGGKGGRGGPGADVAAMVSCVPCRTVAIQSGAAMQCSSMIATYGAIAAAMPWRRRSGTLSPAGRRSNVTHGKSRAMPSATAPPARSTTMTSMAAWLSCGASDCKQRVMNGGPTQEAMTMESCGVGMARRRMRRTTRQRRRAARPATAARSWWPRSGGRRASVPAACGRRRDSG